MAEPNKREFDLAAVKRGAKGRGRLSGLLARA